ncbi:hypothetical protein [Helicobacter sp. MIT 01-3238]|nr:hypothetical protein [Helicobacter sp. MIT 01-3238]
MASVGGLAAGVRIQAQDSKEIIQKTKSKYEIKASQNLSLP